ncbi:MAG: flagellar motor protein MotB [Enterobacteriaceae bacterium]|jgi:chemotaxis protein MotB|nr:flagellar motor protein MotB [Enterobacteriaceae bacterium]
MKNNHNPVMVVRKSGSHKSGHHSGSWKIAYADFMTAMMAFFLVMWLLSSSSPEQRQQIAEYFKMPLKVSIAQGDRNSLSDSVIPGGGEDVIRQQGEVMKKTVTKRDDFKGKQSLQRAREKLESLINTDPRLNNFKSSLLLSVTKDGLLIQITDSKDRPMFPVGGRIPDPYMVSILQALVPILNELPNRINMTGHTDSLPYANGESGYSNWELSSDRANAARRILVNSGLANDKFLRVIGTADTMSQTGTKADDPINRRISILALSPEKEQQILQEDVLLQPQNAVSASDVSENTVTPPILDAHDNTTEENAK